MNDTALEILATARELIAEPEHWQQGMYASNRDGFGTSASSPSAIKFCIMGALSRAAFSLDSEIEAVREAENILRGFLGVRSLVTYNDHHSHAEVLAALDGAIKQEKERNG